MKKNKKKKIKYYIRPPIITIMGHVNHGKTSLINAIISKNIIKKEKGNITQYIKTYKTKTKYGNLILIDTPGHSAFKNIRKIGANITDLILLIISIEDGIMKQTKESINLSKKYNIPLLIAINKIDKKEYKENIKKIKEQSNKLGIKPKEWGGKYKFFEISTKTKKNIDNLLKNIFLKIKKEKLKTNINKLGKGYIIESYLDKGKIIKSKIILKEGNIKIGNIILLKNKYGKIKSIYDDSGKKIKKAIPSMPIKIIGLPINIKTGEKFKIIKSEKKSKNIIKKYKKIKKNKNIKIENNIKNIFFNLKNKKKKNLIIKADVYSSIKAIKQSIKKISENYFNIISYKIGNINETDIKLSKITNSTIIAFNVKIENQIKKKINKLNIKIHFYYVIYELIKKLKKYLLENKKTKNKENIIGEAKIKNIFNYKKNKIIIGCIVTKGYIKKNKKFNIIRNKKNIYKGNIESIRIFKEKVNIVKKGKECGIKIKNYHKIKIGDYIKITK